MAKCQVCAYENEDGAEYCEECGVRMGGAPSAPSAAQPSAQAAPIASGLSVASQPAADVEPPSPPPAHAAPAAIPVATPAGTPVAAPVAAAAGMVTCTACHSAMPEGTRFCPKCGARHDAPGGAPAAVAGRCPACNAEAEPGAVFCMSCGARVSGEAPPAPKPKGEVIRLRMVAGKDKDKLFEIEKTEVRIGRLNENDIPLESDGYVSGKHTRISKQGGEFFVEDLGSTNGTFLKVRKLTRLSPGDEIKVGQSIFRLE